MSSARSHFSAFGLALWLEAVTLAIAGLLTGDFWLLPAAGFAALFASLLTGHLSFGIPFSLLPSGVWIWAFLKGDLNGQVLSIHAVIALLAGSALAFLHILTGLKQPETGNITALSLRKVVVFFHFACAGIILGILHLGAAWQPWLAWAITAVNLALVSECLLHLAGRLYTPRRYWSALPAPGTFFFYRWLGPAWQSTGQASADGSHETGLKLAEMWMWPTLRSSIPALAATIALLVWLLSSLHELPAGHSGVRHHLGRWEEDALSPGLHLSLPWPLGGVEAVPTGLVQEVVLGFKADAGKPILWEKAHYEEEQKSLVGGGDDFLAISVPVFYRISDPTLYLKAANHAESHLKSIAERLLLRLTLHLPARDIMTEARESLRANLHAGLQKELDAQRSGLTITDVYFRDIHPPVAVAPNFQEVVSALEEKEAALHEGESYQRDIRTRTRGDAAAILITAASVAENRRQQAEGQASRYRAMQSSWSRAPELYQWREGFRALDETLAGAKKAVFDEAVHSQIPTHVDLRKVLNPDFVDTVPPRSQSLVPRPSVSRDSFDLDIEGHLRSGAGEVPAISTAAPEPDNLLKNPPAESSQP